MFVFQAFCLRAFRPFCCFAIGCVSFLAMYERDGLPLEKVLKNIIRTRFLYPRVRPYKTENFYALLSARKEAQPIAKQQKGRKARRQKA